MLTTQRKKWRIRNLIARIIRSLKNRNGKLQQINFILTSVQLCQKTNYAHKKEMDIFVVFLEIMRFGVKAKFSVFVSIVKNTEVKYCLTFIFIIC